ncbi:hypothetical protein HPB52_003546 [Rhipicephalus sanguineus]|uniref:Regulatory protein zeste n=1 Tax=Rhipicephalus sanguineus TaxID=34632 RepID=A0A9D4QG81_RHISA|nr:hypothetical protein HPB52_003546 [Rhipicephalus sanguineus]
MERHSRLVFRAGELDSTFTAFDRNRLWEELARLLNDEGPPIRSAREWRIWWTKFVHRCRRDAGDYASEMRTTSNQTRQWQPKHKQPSLVQVASQAGSRAHQLQGRAHLLEGVGLAHVAQLASGVHQTAVLEKGLKSVADAVKELCEIGRRQEERLRRLEENLSPLATLATSTVVVLPQQPMPGQQPPQPPQ